MVGEYCRRNKRMHETVPVELLQCHRFLHEFIIIVIFIIVDINNDKELINLNWTQHNRTTTMKVTTTTRKIMQICSPWHRCSFSLNRNECKHEEQDGETHQIKFNSRLTLLLLLSLLSFIWIVICLILFWLFRLFSNLTESNWQLPPSSY